jgi:phosphatidate cytidylyltransferase
LIWISASFASDAGALVIGSKYGKHKRCPLISPKKSWEGLLAAVLGGVTASVTLFTTRIDDTGDISLKDFLALGIMGNARSG